VTVRRAKLFRFVAHDERQWGRVFYAMSKADARAQAEALGMQVKGIDRLCRCRPAAVDPSCETHGA
jgi:hypothetical protein